MRFDYYYGKEGGQFTFYRLPRLLITDARFRDLSDSAKLLYGLMLDRMSLSIRNEWFDSEGRVYIRYSFQNIMRDLNCGSQKVAMMMDELEKIGLIRRVQVRGHASVIYVKNFVAEIPEDREEYFDNQSTDEKDKREDSGQGTLKIKAVPCEGFGEEVPEDAVNTPLSKEAYKNGTAETTLKIEALRKSKYFDNQSSGTLKIKEQALRKSKQNKNLLSQSNQSQNPIDQSSGKDADGRMDQAGKYLALIRKNLDYDNMMQDTAWRDRSRYEELYRIVCDIVCVPRKTVRIAGEEYPYELVKSRFLKLMPEHLEYVIEAMDHNTTKVKNIRSYLITALYNAPVTIDSFYAAAVNHDLYGA